MTEQKADYYIGLMSGTSLDGVDAALVRIDSSSIELIEQVCIAIPSVLKSSLQKLSQDSQINIEQLGQTHIRVAKMFAQAVETVIQKAKISKDQVVAIGSHGITIRHCPELKPSFTMQIGDASVLAQLSGVDVVADFRSMDVAAGGQGAPLVPKFHQFLLGSRFESCIVVNLGGIANITVINDGKLIGFDTGPANTLLDLWCQRHIGKSFDYNGEYGLTGALDSKLLESLLKEPYFAQPYPKSTGKELFNLAWLDTKLAQLKHAIPAENVQQTLMHLTAISLSDAIKSFAVDDVLVAGGGAANMALMNTIKSYLPANNFHDFKTLELDPDALEAMAFAWFAYCRLHNIAVNSPSVTGACKEVVMGAWYSAK